MDRLQQDYFFWRFAHFYIFNKGFRVLDQSSREIWLEDEESKPKKILRIVRVDIDFSSWLRKDVVQSVKQFERIRRHMRCRKLVGENIYISLYPPVDDWEDVRTAYFESEKKRTTVHSNVIDKTKTHETEVTDSSSLETIEDIEMIILHLKQQIRQATKEREHKEKSLFFYGKPIATVALLVIIAFMFYMLEQVGSSTSVLTLIEFGAKYNPLIIGGEWWRLFTAMFLHIGFLHLFMNSLALFYLGSAVERMYGTWRFLFIYFVAGLSGSIASFAFNEQVAAGASGAIFGCFGALLYFGTIYRKLFFRTMGKSLLTILVINLVFGFAVPMVDNGAHIGGLIGGFFASVIVHLPKHKKSFRPFLFLMFTILFLLSLFWFGMSNEHKARSPVLELQIGQEYLQQDDIEAAYPFLKRAVEEGAEIPEASFLLAYAEATFENYDTAKELLVQTIDMKEDFHEAHYNLSLVYIELNEIEEARYSIDRAIQIYPDEMYLDLQERLSESPLKKGVK
ncbi:rhomboid family protein [Halalkalibacter okhensis]|uniref:Rhomboid protein membrane-associated serine peptidase n=1 Tax=Halalkalibacter okhensis TaxID=333138 RepID=A0A0B0IGW9_9BACI|nr:rhomboid family intramembrane serine protease [Halalkalibacter okhensis]KHF41828.1 rhomboid protein membrane-associated serine peptidase [Halalkalibacter okhensis]